MGLRPPRFLFDSRGQLNVSEILEIQPKDPTEVRSERQCSEKFESGFLHSFSLSPLSTSIEIELSSEESHHLKNVLRLREGEKVEIFDLSSNLTFHGKFQAVRSGACQIILSEVLRSALDTSREGLTLYMGLIKPEDCDLIVEKCTELGANKIVFFAGERSQYSLKGDKALNRLGRWEKIVRVALKQCYSPVRTEIAVSPSLQEALSSQSSTPSLRERRVLMHPPSDLPDSHQPQEQNAKNIAFFDLRQELQPPAHPPLQNIQEYADSYIIVGPEGGLTAAEVGFAKSWGYKPCTFIGNVLRAETAAIVSCGIFRSLY